MGQLNIKDDEIIARLRQLADRRSTSVTDVLRQIVDREVASDEARIAAKLAAIREITRGSAALFPPGSTSDHSDLYDEHGLPK